MGSGVRRRNDEYSHPSSITLVELLVVITLMSVAVGTVISSAPNLALATATGALFGTAPV